MSKPDVIDFNLETKGDVAKVKTNTYEHCDFRKLTICGFYTSVGFVGGV